MDVFLMDLLTSGCRVALRGSLTRYFHTPVVPIYSARAGEKTAGLDPEELDFDPEEEDETMLRLKALETQVSSKLTSICAPLTCSPQAKKLIPNYGSPPRPRSSSEDSTNLPTTSRYLTHY